MRVAIQVVSGPAAGQRFVLRSGQVASIGKSAWNDFSFADDDRMCDTQFLVRCDRGGVQLVDKATESPTQLNGKPLLQQSEQLLQHGDRVLAGRTELLFAIEGAESRASLTAAAAVAVTPSIIPTEWISERASYLELSEPGLELSLRCPSPNELETELQSLPSMEDALRWKGYHIENSKLIGWLYLTISGTIGGTFNQDTITSVYTEAMNLCSQWIQDPSETHRASADSMAIRLKRRGVYGSLLSAIGWSGGSLTAPPLDPVPPDVRLTSRCVAISIGFLAQTVTAPQRKKTLSEWILSMPAPDYSSLGPKA